MSQQRREIFSDINITPLTDIFLVLLIMMMVIAPLLDSHGLKLAVPTVGPSSNTKTEPKAITLRIDGVGNCTINNEPVSHEALQQRLFSLKSQFPEGLLIEVAPDTLHGPVVEAMDAARSAGIDKIAVNAQPTEK